VATFKILTWNMENLFSPVPPAKLQLLASVISRYSPHIVAMQEIGGEEPLKDLQAELIKQGHAYEYFILSTHPDSRGIRVAFISQVPLDKPHDIVLFPDGAATRIFEYDGNGNIIEVKRMSRGALAATAKIGKTEITIITAHLKSKLLSFPRPHSSSFTPNDENERAQTAGIALAKRMAEAVTLRQSINSLLEKNSATPLIILGDFNDVPEAQTSLISCGPSGSEIGTGGFDIADAKDDVRLWNLAPCIEIERRYSRIEHGRKELLDQIFVSEELLPRGPDGHRKLPKVDSLVDFAQKGEEAINSIGSDPTKRKSVIAPDHAPVFAEFNFF
jgi:endonuclease/exonuclease/phosphatase family metal-dependent hydrolase